MVAIALIAVTVVKGLAEFLATYFVNYVGHSVVRDLRNLLYSRIIQQSIGFLHPESDRASDVGHHQRHREDPERRFPGLGGLSEAVLHAGRADGRGLLC